MKAAKYIVPGAILFIVINFFAYQLVVSEDYAIVQSLKLHLSEIGKINSQLDKQTLHSKQTTIVSYDKIVDLLEQMEYQSKNIASISQENSDFIHLQKKIEELLLLIERKKKLLENFKSKNAILRNSLSSIGVLLHENNVNNVPMDITTIENALLKYSLYGDYTSQNTLTKKISVAKGKYRNARRSYEKFFLHANVILNLSPEVDDLLVKIINIDITGTSKQIMSDTEAVAQKHLQNLRYSILLFVALNFIFFLIITLIAIRLARKSKELRSFNESLEENIKERTHELVLAKEIAQTNAQIKQDFLANMSHEIRTPMSAILGFCNLLQEKFDNNKEQSKFLSNIHNATTNLLTIINDIIDFSIIESGKLKIDNTSFKIEDTINGIAEIYKSQAQQKNIELKVTIGSDIPEYIIGDPVRINQIIVNLVGNALKFTENGTVEISVYVGDEKNIFFEVKDTGIGISKDKFDKIFESFSQAESYTTRKYGGTGLGLSISKNLVHLMGGDISVSSEPNKGSTFYFYLPLKEGDPPTSDGDTDFEIPSVETVKVLVLEDNHFIQALIQNSLSEFGCDYFIAENGQKGLDQFNSEQYDMVLTDIQMPVMDGHEFTRNVRSSNHTIPIIAMTAHAMESERKKCLETGMNSVLLKPFKPEELKKVLYEFGIKPKQTT